MVYEAGKKLSKKEIDLFKNAKDIRQIHYLGVRLVDEQCEYDPKKIAEYAIKRGYASKFGYLAEASLEAAVNLKVTKNLSRVEKLIEFLYPYRSENYEFLFSRHNNDFNKRLNSLVINKSGSELNKKWRVYDYGTVSDIEDYIELYLIDLREGNYIKICSPEFAKSIKNDR